MLSYKTLKEQIFDISPDKCQGGATQDSSKKHEKKCEECFKSIGIEEYEPQRKKFREDFKEATDIKWQTVVREQCSPSYTIKPDSFTNMTEGKPYYVSQPSGTQDYPDFVLIKKKDNMIFPLYMECKQSKPTWNNNPPKYNKYCMYICGNKIFNGSHLVSKEGEKRIKELIKELTKVIDNFNGVPDELKENIRAFLYKKIELASFPPPDFNEEENDKLNESVFNEFIL